MTEAPRGPVVIDTGVFGARLTRRTSLLAGLYQPLVEGRAALISFLCLYRFKTNRMVSDLGS